MKIAPLIRPSATFSPQAGRRISRSRALLLVLLLAIPGALFAADPSQLVLLNSGSVDLRRSAPESFDGKRLHLIQFTEAVRPEWRASVVATGVEVVAYIPNNAYLVYGDADAIAKVRQLSSSVGFVRGEGDYLDEYKVHPILRPGVAGMRKQNPATSLFAVQLVDDPPANAATLQLINSLKLEDIKSQFRLLRYLNLIVKLPADAISVLSTRPDVISIQPYVLPTKLDERQDQIVAGNLSGNVPSGPGYLTWLASKGFTQSQFTVSGFAVDVTDSGIDDGTTVPNHFALYEGGVLTAPSHVIYNRLEGTANIGSTLMGCDGHGTLNAHLISGFDNLTPFPHTDGSGYHYGLGVAPFVRVGSSVIFDPTAYTFPNFPNLQSEAYNDGARISSNAWGSSNGGAYDITAQTFDALTRDAQPTGATFASPGNQEMVMVFAAGNSGPGIQTVASPATAKNVLAIGASESVQAFGGADGCGVTDSDADSANDVASFSSRGPTNDGRRKPELVAPGTHVSGGLIETTTPGSNGQADACFTGSGICGAVGTNFFPAAQQYFTASSGTSHSSPAVAGAAALLRQSFINQGFNPPSPAMTRAYLVNSARYLTGAGGNDNRWSIAQGMGSVNLGSAFDGTPRILRDQASAEMFTATGQTRMVTGTISNSSKPLRVTLAWTDAPGSTTGAAYNNNLDLTVSVGGTTYLGNVFSGPNSITGGAADPVNNLESVFLPSGLSGTFAVTVKATNINSDGVPNVGGPLDQDFALVIYNAVETSVPVISAASSQLTTEGCAPPNSAIDPDETVSVSFGLANIGTAPTTNLVATLEQSGGITAPSGPQSYGSVAPNGVPAFQPFQFTAAGTCGGAITATFHLQDGSNDLGVVRFIFPLGANAGGTAVVQNTTSITIPDSGIGIPYPSPITVSGVTGTVTKVTVTLVGVTHTFPDDIGILLVGPHGQSVILMADAGGGTDLNNAQLTFDDAAPFKLPDEVGITPGTYKPTSYPPGDSFPAPAPPAPWGSALSVFNGLDPNGTWKLYVIDDTPQDQGTISGGWKLNITTSLPTCCIMPGTLQFSAAQYSADEGPVGARIQVTRTAGNLGTVSVTFATSDGTATAGSDYIATTETVTFPPGDSGPKTVVVPLLDDLLDEYNETVNLQLSNPTGGAILGALTTAVLTIIDNDPPPSLSVNDVSVVESDSGTVNAVFTLTLSTASGKPISVDYATADGTAIAGEDYVITSGTAQFSPGVTTQTVTVTVNADSESEGSETFFLNLNNAVNVTLSRAQATGTIVDDDTPTISSVAPTSGPAAGGTSVTIQGTSFLGGASVMFATAPASNVVVSSSTQITCTGPTLSPGTLNDVKVTNTNTFSGTLVKGFLADFLDVPGSHPFHAFVEKIFRRGITSGCGAGNFCPDASATRAQMAIFLLIGEHGSSYVPPPATGTVFADVPIGSFAAAYIEQLYAEGITRGCAASPLRYCPTSAVNRAQMSVLLLATEHGGSYTPPPATGIFADVPLSNPFVGWIEQLYREGITAGCGSNPLRYCPDQDVTRGQMAVFLSRTFNLAPIGE